MEQVRKLFEMGMQFHGHKCPAMPLGLRAGLAAMEVLGVERSQDKELFIRAETGKGHAASCFLDGLMVATGCTYGKGNIEKLYYYKMAFTLVDIKSGRSVRVSLNPEFFQNALNSPFVQQRKKGVPPQEIPAEIADPLVEKVMAAPTSAFLDIGPVKEEAIPSRQGMFEARPCAECGELVFVNKLRLGQDGKLRCVPCSGYGE